MTAQELAAIKDRKPESIHTPHTTYSGVDDYRHDRYGNDTNDHHVFDASHSEDAFPY